MKYKKEILIFFTFLFFVNFCFAELVTQKKAEEIAQEKINQKIKDTIFDKKNIIDNALKYAAFDKQLIDNNKNNYETELIEEFFKQYNEILTKALDKFFITQEKKGNLFNAIADALLHSLLILQINNLNQDIKDIVLDALKINFLDFTVDVNYVAINDAFKKFNITFDEKTTTQQLIDQIQAQRQKSIVEKIKIDNEKEQIARNSHEESAKLIIALNEANDFIIPNRLLTKNPEILNQEVISDTGITPLMWLNMADENPAKDIDNIRFLLNRNPNLDLQDKDLGFTALMYAVWKGNPKIVELIVEKGANKDIKDKWGFTAFDIAQGKAEINTIKPQNKESLLKALNKKTKQ